jgi:MFS family permease
MGVVSSGSKMARNFVRVRGYILLLFTSISVANSRQIFSARLREKFGRRRKILVADFLHRGSPKLCFAAGISAGLATLMFVITEDPLKKNGAKF